MFFSLVFFVQLFLFLLGAWDGARVSKRAKETTSTYQIVNNIMTI